MPGFISKKRLWVYVEESENVNNRRSQKYTTFLCKTVNLQHNIS